MRGVLTSVRYCIIFNIQVHLKKIEYHEKGQYFLSLISESEPHILYRFITHRVKYFKPLFLDILMIMADNENPKFRVSENYNVT